MSLDFAPAIYAAITADATITGLLSEHNSNPAVFTSVPIPAEVSYPYIVVYPDTTIGDMDALVSKRPMPVRNIGVYGQQPDDYRTVEQIGYLLRTMFHRERFSLTNADYDIVLITVDGPFAAPTDDDHTVGRMVTLNITTREKP